MNCFVPAKPEKVTQNSSKNLEEVGVLWGNTKKLEGDKSPLIQSATSIEAQARESKGQKEFLQAILAKLHLKKRWEVESNVSFAEGAEQIIWRD
jgi:hypothetical protein